MYFTKVNGICYSPDGQGSKCEPQIEVTREMIEAGLNVLLDSGRLADGALSSDELLAEEVFRAMMASRQSSKS